MLGLTLQGLHDPQEEAPSELEFILSPLFSTGLTFCNTRGTFTSGSFFRSLSRRTVRGTPKIPLSAVKTAKRGRKSKRQTSSLCSRASVEAGSPAGSLVTSAFPPLRLVSFQWYPESIEEGRQFNQREMADFLHVFGRQVSCFGQPKSGFLNNKFLKHTGKVLIFEIK